MTRDEILNMPAGREMDKLIAEKVTHINFHFAITFDTKKHYGSDLPFYSTDIAAAWEVIEVLSKDGYAPNLVNDDGGKWYLSFDGTQNLDPVTFVTAFTDVPELWCESASLAICRAALLAEV